MKTGEWCGEAGLLNFVMELISMQRGEPRAPPITWNTLVQDVGEGIEGRCFSRAARHAKQKLQATP